MSAKPKSVLTMAAAAKELGVTPDFLMALTLGGARQPDQRGGELVEIDYVMDGNEVMFTPAGLEKFQSKCPVGDLVPAVKVAERLGIHRSQLSIQRFTGVMSADGVVVKLPMWQIAGGEYVEPADLEAFAAHHKAAVDRKAARDHAKKYDRSGRKAAPST